MRKIQLLLAFIFLLAIGQTANSQVVISQVYGAGGNTGATYTHDFIELFNRGTSPVSLSGWSLQYASATGTGNFGASATQITELPAIVLQPGQYFLVQEAGGTIGLPLPTADLIDPTPIAMAAGAGKVALVNTTSPLGCNGTSTVCSATALATIVDLVGYGSANFFEGAGAAPTLTAILSAFRASNGCTDNNNNAADFATGTPNARNTATALNPCSGPPVLTVSVAAGINASEPSTNGTFTVTLSTAAPASGVTVTYTLGGSASSGVDYNDALAGSIIIPQGNTSGTITLSPNDDLFFEGTESISITLNTATNSYTIPVGTSTASISLLDNDSPPSVSVLAGLAAAEPGTNGTFTINLSATAPAGGVAVTYTLGGTAALNTDYSDALSGSIVIPAGSNSATITLSVTDDAFIEGTETISITLNSAANSFVIGTPNSAIINLNDNDNPPIVVNEVYGGGGNSGSNFKNDFIELYNNSNVPVNLSGWSVQYNSATGTGSWQVTNLTGTIPAHGYYLVQEGAGAGGIANLPTPDATGGIAMAAGSGKVALVNNTTALVGTNPLSIAIVDKVGYGTVAIGYEGAGPAPTPSGINSIQRTPIGFDANNNNTDFTLGLPTPKNSVTDVTAPAVSAFSPVNGATNVATAFTAAIIFNENVEKGTGTITFRKTVDGSILKTFNVSSADVTVAGNSASFLIQGLAFNTSYYFEVSSGTFKDLSGNNFAGFTGTSTWSFTTRSQPIGIVGNLYNFNACTSGLTDGFSFFSAVGAQVWACTSFGRNAADLPLGSAPNAVQINGFAGGTNVPNVDWLISPSFNLTATTYPLLSFWSRVAFNGQPLLLKISTDYVSGDPSSATWTDLNGKFPAATSNVWTLSENINLSAYKQSNVHFAFVYYSDEDEGARWTVDDISIINSATPPPPSLTIGTTDIQFAYAAAGTTADKTFMFIGNDLTNDVTMNATGAFTLSKDGVSFSSSLLYTVAEANNIAKTVYVRFAPTQNNQAFIGTITIASGDLTSTINLKGTSIDPITTLEVVNWNVEWLGSTGFGPTNEDQQEQNVETVLKNIGADIYGLVEVVDEARLARIVSHMPGYSYIIGNFGSRVNPPDPTGGPLSEAQKLAFVYKTSLFSNITSRPLINNKNTSSTSYNSWSSGRYPFLMTADVTLNCVTKTVNFILIHGKANTSPTATSYARRQAAANELHDTLTTYFADANVMVIGDFNDDLDQSITAGFTTTSYSSFTTDMANFFSPTLALSLAGKKSTVGYNDVIDHVMITNDMQPYYLNSSASILTDVASLVSNYGSTTTDHYPVFTRYRFSNTTAPAVTTCTEQVTFCSNTGNSYTIPAFVATDDCGDVVTYNYSITGATERNGTSSDASGTFNVGTSIITWTATDNWSNIASCQTTVLINQSPTVTIPDAYALPSGVLANTVYIGYAPASSITLSASVTGGTPTYGYVWSSGSMVSTATVNPITTTAYNVTVTDANGCQGSANKTVNVIDIRGGNKSDKVVVCHRSNSLIMDGNAVATHLAHGDNLGRCPVPNRTVPGRSSSITENSTSANGLSVRVLSNPSMSEFTLMISATSKTEKITLRVLDIHGRVVEQRVYSSPNQTVKLGNQYHSGLYFVEILQGKEKKVLKLIKL